MEAHTHAVRGQRYRCHYGGYGKFLDAISKKSLGQLYSLIFILPYLSFLFLPCLSRICVRFRRMSSPARRSSLVLKLLGPTTLIERSGSTFPRMLTVLQSQHTQTGSDVTSALPRGCHGRMQWRKYLLATQNDDGGILYGKPGFSRKKRLI